MPAPDLIYIGNCGWEPSGEPEPDFRRHEIPVIREPWLGRSDEIEDFLTDYAIGDSYLGGIIVSNTPRDNTPFPGVASADLIIFLPPDDEDYTADDTWSTKTASASDTVTLSGVIEGEDELECSRDMSFRSPGTRYTYFALTRPTAALFAAPLTAEDPVVKKIVTRATAGGITVTFDGSGAPSSIATALAMPVVNVLDGPEVTQIPGTEWFKCVETWSREREGD